MIPKIQYPLYEIYLKSLDRKVKCRPFLVKEEKILLIAKEANDAAAAKLAVKQIIQNCVQEELDVDKLPLFDIEMIFVKLRAKSVGETVKLSFNCQNIPDGSTSPCNADTDYNLDLDKVSYEIPEGHESKIMVTDTVGIKLKYPTIETDVVREDSESDYDKILDLLMGSIEYIFDADSVTKPEDAPEADLIEFVESLTPDIFDKIRGFFFTSPKVLLEDTVVCSKCGFQHKLRTEGLLDFFL